MAGLVLIAPSVGGAPEPAHGLEVSRVLARLRAAEDTGDLRAVNAVKARLWLDGPLAREGRVTGEARRLFLAMNGVALRSPFAGASLDTVSTYARLGEVRAPTLVLWGDLDLPHIQDRSRYVAETVPDGTALKLSGTAQLPSLDQPAAVIGPLLSSLARVGSRPWCAGID